MKWTQPNEDKHGYQPRRQAASQQALKKCRRSLFENTKRLLWQITEEACRLSPRNYGMRRNLEGISTHLRRDIGLPPDGSTFFISRDTSRCYEPYDSDLYSASKLVGNPAQMSEPHFVPSLASIGVVFADLHGFTTISEAIAPVDVMGLLQDFHSRMEMIALRHGGSLAVSVGRSESVHAYILPREGNNRHE